VPTPEPEPTPEPQPTPEPEPTPELRKVNFEAFAKTHNIQEPKPPAAVRQPAPQVPKLDINDSLSRFEKSQGSVSAVSAPANQSTAQKSYRSRVVAQLEALWAKPEAEPGTSLSVVLEVAANGSIRLLRINTQNPDALMLGSIRAAVADFTSLGAVPGGQPMRLELNFKLKQKQ
jgi:outer membrane biosynthesis protein TonB